MSAIPADPPFHSQLAAHLNNRRHHQPTATHRPPCTRKQPPPKSLVNSRNLSSNAHTGAPVPTSPLPSRKSPKIMQIQLQTIPPISRKLSSSLVKRSYERTCANVAPPIPEIPKKSCKSSFRQSPQSLVNFRHLSSNAHTSAPAPAAPLPSRKSPKILQILRQTNPPISHKLSSSLVKRSHERPAPAAPLPSRKSPKIMQIQLQIIRPISRQTLVISRQTLTRALASSRRPSHPENLPKSCKSCFRQSPQSLINSRHHSSNAHTSAPAPAAPLPSRKSPKIMQILLQTIPPISHKLSSSLVKRSCERTCASGAPPIPKIPKNPANPASDNPPNSNHSPSPISHDLVQAVLLSTIHYPLSTGVH